MSQKKEDRLASLRNARRKKDRRKPGQLFHLKSGRLIQGFTELEDRELGLEKERRRKCLSGVSAACSKVVVGTKGARICRDCRACLNNLGLI